MAIAGAVAASLPQDEAFSLLQHSLGIVEPMFSSNIVAALVRTGHPSVRDLLVDHVRRVMKSLDIGPELAAQNHSQDSRHRKDRVAHNQLVVEKLSASGARYAAETSNPISIHCGTRIRRRFGLWQRIAVTEMNAKEFPDFRIGMARQEPSVVPELVGRRSGLKCIFDAQNRRSGVRVPNSCVPYGRRFFSRVSAPLAFIKELLESAPCAKTFWRLIFLSDERVEYFRPQKLNPNSPSSGTGGWFHGNRST